eukprot:4864374-Amphidinium_carterae.4
MLRARLQFTESNAYDAQRIAEYEHSIAKEVLREGRAFNPYVEQQTRGFSLEESQAARTSVD